MKMKKMVGALALTAALAMGTAPAFATSTDTEFSDSGSTEVKAKVDTVNKQVRASVPLQVGVVFGATGGGEITGPTAGAYKVTNIGEGDIKLTNIELTDMHTTFTSSPIYYDGTDYMDLSGNAYTSGNHIMLTITTANNNAYLTESHPANAQKTLGDDKTAMENLGGAKKWADEPIAVGADLPITLGGLHWFKDTLTSGEMTDTLCNLKVTIAAA